MGAKFPAGLRMRPLAVLIGVALASGMFSRQANASCDTQGSEITCSGTTTTPVQMGPGTTLTVAQDASIATPSAQPEAISVNGAGNTIVNRGTISSVTNTIVFSGSGSGSTRNTIDNYGTISTQSNNSLARSVIEDTTNFGLTFTNNTGGGVVGDLTFGSGDDQLTLVTGSTVSGNVDGGSGTNSMTLVSEAGTEDTYSGNIQNVQTLMSEGPGLWTLSGNILQNADSSYITIDIGQGGGLALTGANKAIGDVTINPMAAFHTSAQGLHGDITMSSATATGTDSGVTFVQDDDATYAGRLLGAGSVTKQGNGVLTLSNDQNTYTGTTEILAGTIAITADGALGSTNGLLELAGGTLRLDNASGIALATGRQINITGAIGTIETTGGNSTVSQSIGGDGAFVKRGTGTLTLTGNSVYTNGTTIDGGTLQLGDGGTTGRILGGVLINEGAVLAFNRSDNFASDNALSGSGSVVHVGGGATTLQAGNTYSGGTTISNGTITINADSALGDAAGAVTLNGGTLRLNSSVDLAPTRAISIGAANGTIATATDTTSTVSQAITGSGALTKEGQGTLVLTGGNLYQGTTIADGTLQLGNGGQTGSISGDVINNGTLVFNRSDAVAVGNTISGTGEVVQSGSGKITLTGTNTYQGGTTISNGVIAISTDAALGDASGALRLNGGTLNLDSGITLSATRAVSITGQNGTIHTADATESTLSQSISGSGALTKSGTGTLTLAGNNEYTGTSITGGTLQVGNGGTAGYVKGPVNISAGSVLAINRSDNALELDGVISGDGMVVQQGTGKATLTGTNTYTGGTQLNAGTLSVASDANLGAASGKLTFNSGTLLNTAGFTTARDVTISASGGSFDTAGALSITGSLSGSGSIAKRGNSTLTLAGNNDYSGDIDVRAGTLMANSTLGGRMNVASGASLGGTGTVGGVVTIAPGATLLGRQGQVLTFGSDLTLHDGSLVNVALGAPESAGLFDVAGDLVLDGQLNISDMGGFGAGVYRLFNYGGQLTDNALGIGTVPSGTNSAALLVQTSQENQVNLINATGVTLNFWDGGSSTNQNNGVINGGNGTWNTSSPNWTGSDGAVNGTWADGNFAIFQGQAGTVTVDANAGISATGMQFATDGYRIQGGPLTLSGAPTTIRVGDGSNQGAGVTATIDSVLTGTSGVHKTDAGTLVLTGANTYSGGTTISGGTLQLGNGATSGSLTGDVTNNAMLAFNRSDSITFAGAISGNGSVAQLGGGKTTLAGNNSYSGGTTISNGTLAIGPDTDGTDRALGGPNSAVTLNGGTLQLNGGVSLSPTRAFNITANNGTIEIEGGASSAVDQVIGGPGALTKSGTGTLALGGENTYLGGTTISGGTLQLGHGGTSGSISGNVVNNGVLSFNRSGNVTFDGEISGTGSVVLQGTGRTTLTHANTYSGGTIVNAGTLAVGEDSHLGASGGTLTLAGGTFVNTASFTMARQVALNMIDPSLGTGGGFFNTATDLTLSGALHGDGKLTKAGGGVLTLGGTGSYSGNVAVQAGTLMVNRSLGGEMDVATGGVLGGTGTVSGVTTIASGATLLGRQGQTLTFGSDLSLASGSLVNVELGTPEDSGLFNVIGNLTLDGQLNVSNLGGFGPGSYRLFDYGGSLTDNGLDIGTVPTGITLGDLSIQTSQANEVNLVNASGVNLGFWDGADQDNVDNGAVDGGNGTWGGNGPNWTDKDGSANGMWENGRFAVFQGQPGTVTVDTDGISAAGMQFAIDGYQIQGGPITLTHEESIIRTGVGGASNAAATALTATIASDLVGSAGLTKTDAGRLVLTGANTYTGNTIIRAGKLQLGDGGTSGSIIGDVAINQGGQLIFHRSDDALSLGGAISGAGSVTHQGSGTTTLTGANTYTGGTYISNGTLQVGDGGETGSIVGAVTTSHGGALAFHRSNTGTFSGELTGSGSLIQRGSGTTILTGHNTHTGGTRITHGTLQVGNGGTTGSIQSHVDIAEGATLAFHRSNAEQFGGMISGSGEIRHLGSGRTTLTAHSTDFVGTTNIVHGTLAVNGSLCGAMNVGAGGRLQGTGNVCDTTNRGTVAPGNSIGTLTIAGNYVGAGGTLEMEAVLGGDDSPSDKLVVTGDTSGTTHVRVINDGGTGAQTVNGIKLIDVGGISTGAFSLVGDYVIQGQPAVVAGAYAYTLQKDGVSTPDGDWYLRSSLVPGSGGGNGPQPPSGPLYQPGVPVYEAYPSVLQGLNGLSTLQERVGNQFGRSGYSASPSEFAGQYTRSGPGDGVWARVEGVNSRFEPKHSATGFTAHTDQYKVQLGVDHSLIDRRNGRLVGGLNAQYGNASSSVDSFYGKGRINADVYGLGTSLTWYDDNGYYLDGQAKLNWFNSTLSSRTLGRGLAKDNDGFGYALGVETGKRIGLGNGWGVTPQAQLQYSSVDFDSFTDPYGARVSLESGDSLLGRVGLATDHQNVVRDANGKVVYRRSVYGIANLYYEMLNGTAVRVADRRVGSSDERAAGGIGAGATYSWGGDKYSVYGEVMAKTSLANFGESYSYSGTLGLRMRY